MPDRNRNSTLRRLLSGPGLLAAPGAYDAWSARAIERAGFPLVYVGAGNLTATQMGGADISWMTLTEVVHHTRYIASAVSVPVLADADTGYGNAINVFRTVKEFEYAGVSGIHLEDQRLPKRCGHFAGKTLCEVDEMVSKVRAACAARSDPDFVVIARTDAIEPQGIDEAIRRAVAYKIAGADVIFVEAPRSVDELDRIGREVPGPLLVNVVEGGETPELALREYEELGFKIAIYPGTCLKIAGYAMGVGMRQFMATGSTVSLHAHMLSFSERQALTDLEDIRELEKVYLEEGSAATSSEV